MTDSYYPAGNVAPLGAYPTPAPGSFLQPEAAVRAMHRKKRFGTLCFWLLFVMCMVDLNGVMYFLTGKGQYFSYVMLGLCIAMLIVFNVTIYRDLGRAGRLYFCFIISYLLIATRGVISGSATDALINSIYLRLNIPALVIMAACAVAVRHVLLTYRIETILRWVYVSSLLAVAAIFLALYWEPLLARTEERAGRTEGFMGNANEAALAACYALAAGFSCLITEKRKLLVIAGMAAATLAVLTTFSRAYIVLFVIIAVVQVIASPILKRKALVAAVAGVVCFMLWFMLVGRLYYLNETPEHRRRMEHIAGLIHGEAEFGESLDHRKKLGKVGVDAFKKQPMFGTGIGTLRSEAKHRGTGVHNLYLLVAGESGLIPLAFLLAFIVVFAWDAWNCKSPPIKTLVFGHAVIFPLAVIFSHTTISDNNHAAFFGISFGAIIAVRRWERLGVIPGRVTRPNPGWNGMPTVATTESTVNHA